MNLLNKFNVHEDKIIEIYIAELLETNEEIKKYGLELTKEDIKQIIDTRNKVLKGYGRIELSFQVTKKLIENFSSSSFINKKNFPYTINELQEAFYYLKNETEDKIGDDNLIILMKNLFENSCEGSIQFLYGTLEEFSRNYRRRLD